MTYMSIVRINSKQDMSTRKTLQISSASKEARTSHVSKKLTRNPEFKKVLIPSNIASLDFECDMTYCEYLQVLVLSQYVEETTNHYKQIIIDQLAVKNDSLFKLQQKSKQENDRNVEWQKLEEIKDILNYLEDSVENLDKVKQDNDLDMILQDLYSTLNTLSNRITLKNIKPIETQDEYDQFISLLTDCLRKMEILKNSGRDFSKCNKLAECLTTFFKTKESVWEKMGILAKFQDIVTENWMKNTSNMLSKN